MLDFVPQSVFVFIFFFIPFCFFPLDWLMLFDLSSSLLFLSSANSDLLLNLSSEVSIFSQLENFYLVLFNNFFLFIDILFGERYPHTFFLVFWTWFPLVL